MPFFNTNLPQESQQDEYPTFDKTVTVANCYYYLSLLERFVETTRNMSEDVLKVYLVRAEYRYYKWAYSKETDFGSIKNAIPPIDIAFFWQAHMLSPLRFFEDSIRNAQLSEYKNLKIPLKEIHEIDTGIPIHVLTAWKNVMGDEPYHLTQEHLLSNSSSNGSAEISCIVCFVKMEIDWNNYAEWRTNQKSAIKCHRCSCLFTIKHVGKANLIADLTNSRAVAGLLLKENGTRASVDRKEIGAIGPSRKIKAMPFNEGLKPLERLIDIHQAVKYEKDLDNSDRKTRIMDAVESTYMCNPYRGSSLDLIQAVARQYKFAFRVSQSFNWDLPQGIIKGIRQYSRFIHLIKTYPNLTAVPTIEIDLAWHTHMLFPARYRDFTTGYIGRFLNHDDNIAEEQLQQFVEHTDHAWKHFDEPKQETVVAKAVLPEKSEGFKIKMMRKMKMKSSTKKEPKAVDFEKLFYDAYHPGTFQTSPPYDFGADCKKPEDDAVKYDVKHVSFHDKREIKEFIDLRNSDNIMDEKFKRVKESDLGFIGTSTCGATDYLNNWEGSSTAIDKTGASSSGYDTVSYSQVFTSRGPLPPIDRSRLDKLPLDQRMQQLGLGSSPTEKSVSPTELESFNWYKVSFAWAVVYKDKAYVSKVISESSGGIGSSCGGAGIGNCVSGGAQGAEGALAVASLM
ncbi:unnamed protein product [Mucor circinelloides]